MNALFELMDVTLTKTYEAMEPQPGCERTCKNVASCEDGCVGYEGREGDGYIRSEQEALERY